MTEENDIHEQLSEAGVAPGKHTFACPHLRTTILDDRKYCVDCGEEGDRD